MKKTLTKVKYIFVAAIMGAMLVAPMVSSSAMAAKCNSDRGFLGLPYWWRDLCSSSGAAEPEITSPVDAWIIVLNVIEVAMILAGYAAVGYVIWGGFKYVASDGDESRVAAGKKIITHALIGLFIVLGSVAMVNFVLGLL